MLILLDELDSMPLRASINQNVTKGDCGLAGGPRRHECQQMRMLLLLLNSLP